MVPATSVHIKNISLKL